MNAATAARLLDINSQFYQTFAIQFSATRRRLQPGVRRVLAGIGREAHVLDVGCGNGEVGRTLAQRGQRGRYVGLDFSPGLLAEAAADATGASAASWHGGEVGARLAAPVYRLANLAAAGWEAAARPEAPFDFILAFAVLHHLPGAESRSRLVGEMAGLLAPGGRVVVSVWQFLSSRRLRERVQPWEQVGLSAAEVEANDYLLDWRSGGNGLRYVHHFTPAELAALATAAGLRVVDEFHSDGEGGQLGLYQTWQEG